MNGNFFGELKTIQRNAEEVNVFGSIRFVENDLLGIWLW